MSVITMKTDDRVLIISLNRAPTNPLNSEFGLGLFKSNSSILPAPTLATM